MQVGATVKRDIGMYLHGQLSIAPAFGIEVSRWCRGCRREMAEQQRLLSMHAVDTAEAARTRSRALECGPV